MKKHSLIVLGIFAIASLLYATGVITEKQGYVFTFPFIYWVGVYLYNSIWK